MSFEVDFKEFAPEEPEQKAEGVACETSAIPENFVSCDFIPYMIYDVGREYLCGYVIDGHKKMFDMSGCEYEVTSDIDIKDISGHLVPESLITKKNMIILENIKYSDELIRFVKAQYAVDKMSHDLLNGCDAADININRIMSDRDSARHALGGCGELAAADVANQIAAAFNNLFGTSFTGHGEARDREITLTDSGVGIFKDGVNDGRLVKLNFLPKEELEDVSNYPFLEINEDGDVVIKDRPEALEFFISHIPVSPDCINGVLSGVELDCHLYKNNIIYYNRTYKINVHNLNTRTFTSVVSQLLGN